MQLYVSSSLLLPPNWYFRYFGICGNVDALGVNIAPYSQDRRDRRDRRDLRTTDRFGCGLTWVLCMALMTLMAFDGCFWEGLDWRWFSRVTPTLSCSVMLRHTTAIIAIIYTSPASLYVVVMVFVCFRWWSVLTSPNDRRPTRRKHANFRHIVVVDSSEEG